MNTDTLRRVNEIANSIPEYEPSIPDMEERCALDPDPTRPTDPDAFTIDSDRAANWLLRKLANLEAEKARVQAQAAAIVKALDSDAERLRFLYGAQLESYCRAKMEQRRGKSVRFLQGTCAFRTVPASVKIADMGAALAFAQESLPDVIRPTLDTSAYRAAAAKRLQETGEVLPGCEPTPERESFSVKFGKVE